jgi:hypothetical protein
VAADDLSTAWTSFQASGASSREILFVIKTETEIYLAGGK